ncbi:MAG: class I SAM-dependent methyltransferase [Candidatus Tectomicrobia bacterium]|nr:class I SAM-dependent methyltransferase [Candidatus Tectomicrobia bacterium]
MVDYEEWFKVAFPHLELDGLWSILPDTAHFLYHLLIEKKPRHILEFGSGVSTAVMAHAVAPHGGVVYSLEHDEKWLRRTHEMAVVSGVTNYELIHAPLVESSFPGVENFVVYDPLRIPSKQFEFVFIDGPPGVKPEHPGRRGTLYSCWPYLARPSAIIVLDDAEREGEQRTVMEWMRVFGGVLAVRWITLQRPIFWMKVTQI